MLLVVLAVGVRQRLTAAADSPSDALSLPLLSRQVATPDDPMARQAWQRGLYFLARKSSGDLTRALDAFEEARRLNPRFSPAHASAAETLVKMSFAGGLELRQGLMQAREAARRAVAVDRNSAAGHRIEALADLHLDWDFDAASAGIESAWRLAPRDAQTYLAAATFLSAAGSNDAAVRAARRAVELDPASSLLQADLGFFLLAAGRYSEALANSEELLEVEPESIHVLGSLVIAAERLGFFARSLTAAQKIMELQGADEAEVRALAGGDARAGLISFRRWKLATFRASGEPSLLRLAVLQAALRQKESALASLHQAYERHEPWMVYLHSYSSFADLREDPEFLALVRKLGFPRPTDAVVARVESLL